MSYSEEFQSRIKIKEDGTPGEIPPLEDFFRLTATSTHQLAAEFDFQPALEAKIEKLARVERDKIQEVLKDEALLRKLFPNIDQLRYDFGDSSLAESVRDELRVTASYQESLKTLLTENIKGIKVERIVPDRILTQLVEVLPRASYRLMSDQTMIDLVSDSLIAKLVTNGGVSTVANYYRHEFPSLIFKNRYSPVLELVDFRDKAPVDFFTYYDKDRGNLEIQRLPRNPTLLVDYMETVPKIMRELDTLGEAIALYVLKERRAVPDLRTLLPSEPSMPRIETKSRNLRQENGSDINHEKITELMGGRAPGLSGLLEKLLKQEDEVASAEEEYSRLFLSLRNKQLTYSRIKDDPAKTKQASELKALLTTEVRRAKKLWTDLVQYRTMEFIAVNAMNDVMNDTTESVKRVGSRVFSSLADYFTSDFSAYALYNMGFKLRDAKVQGTFPVPNTSFGVGETAVIREDYGLRLSGAIIGIRRERTLTVNDLSNYKTRDFRESTKIRSPSLKALEPTASKISFSIINPVANKLKQTILTLEYVVSPFSSDLEFPVVSAVVEPIKLAVEKELADVRLKNPGLEDYQAKDLEAINNYFNKDQQALSQELAVSLVDSISHDSIFRKSGYSLAPGAAVYSSVPIKTIYDALVSNGSQIQGYEKKLDEETFIFAQRKREFDLVSRFSTDSKISVYSIDVLNGKKKTNHLVEIVLKDGSKTFVGSKEFENLAEYLTNFAKDFPEEDVSTAFYQIENYVKKKKEKKQEDKKQEELEPIFSLDELEPTSSAVVSYDVLVDPSAEFIPRTLSGFKPVSTIFDSDYEGLGDVLGLTLSGASSNLSGTNGFATKIKYDVKDIKE